MMEPSHAGGYRHSLTRLVPLLPLGPLTLSPYSPLSLQVGRTTDSIDAEVHDFIVAEGFYPAPLNYRGFPKSLCAAVNHEICHGIPNARALEDGDVCKFDVSVFSPEGFFGDNCATILVSRHLLRLMERRRHGVSTLP